MFVQTTNKSPEWNSEDARLLKALLGSEVFQKALVILAEQGPSLLDGADVNKTLVASGEVKGYSTCVQNLFQLTYEQPVAGPVSESYPDLEDESKWGKPTP